MESLPDRGRRVRYGKLRFPSCTPFHPPGAPLPSALATRRIPTPSTFWEKVLVSVPVGSFFHVSLGSCALTRRKCQGKPHQLGSVFFSRRVSGGRASGSYQPVMELSPFLATRTAASGYISLISRVTFRITARPFTAFTSAPRSVLSKLFTRKQNNVQAVGS